MRFFNLFLASLGEAGFVRGFSQIVEFALIQPHGSVANGALDGCETFFHVARRIKSWRAPDYLATNQVSLPTRSLQLALAQTKTSSPRDQVCA